MKKIILLMAFVCILCASCERVVTSSYKEVWHGNITKMDTLGKMDITNDEGTVRTWMVGDSLDDVFIHPNIAGSECFSVGDEVFIHAKDGSILASKVSIEDCKVINSRILGSYYSDHFWFWLMLSSFCAMAVIFFIASKFRKGEVFFSIFWVVVFFVLGRIIFSNLVSEKRLYYQDEGVVTEIEENTVILDKQKSFSVFSLDSFNDAKKKIVVGDKVYAYKYGEGERFKGGTTFLATDKLTTATITTYQVYPTFWLYDILLWGASVFVACFLYCLLEFIWGTIFSKKKKLEEFN